MSKLSRFVSTTPFAHLLGLAPKGAAAEEQDEERKQKDGESDDDYAKRMQDLDDEEEAARKAEEEKKKEDARRAEEEKKKEEARRAKKADDDADDADMEDDADDEEEGSRAGRAAAARLREKNRCARILATGIQLGRVNQACAFAFDTGLSSKQAIGALNAASLDAAGTRGTGLGSRMSALKVPNPGAGTTAAGPDADPAKAAAARIIAAGERAHGK